MKTEFENHSRVTVKILEEFAWNQSPRMKLFAKILIAAYAVGVVIIAEMSVRSGVLLPANAMVLFFGACLLVYLWYGPHSTAKRNIKAVKEVCDGEIPDTVLTFGEEITSDSALGESVYEYDQILKVYSLKYSYILLMDNKKGLPVSREGFVKGTFPDFKEFLREKRPDLFIPE